MFDDNTGKFGGIIGILEIYGFNGLKWFEDVVMFWRFSVMMGDVDS